MSIHDLTTSEKEISRKASAELGFPVLVYRDGNWICQPRGRQAMGFGETVELAVADCRKANTK